MKSCGCVQAHVAKEEEDQQFNEHEEEQLDSDLEGLRQELAQACKLSVHKQSSVVAAVP